MGDENSNPTGTLGESLHPVLGNDSSSCYQKSRLRLELYSNWPWSWKGREERRVLLLYVHQGRIGLHCHHSQPLLLITGSSKPGISECALGYVLSPECLHQVWGGDLQQPPTPCVALQNLHRAERGEWIGPIQLLEHPPSFVRFPLPCYNQGSKVAVGGLGNLFRHMSSGIGIKGTSSAVNTGRTQYLNEFLFSPLASVTFPSLPPCSLVHCPLTSIIPYSPFLIFWVFPYCHLLFPSTSLLVSHFPSFSFLSLYRSSSTYNGVASR